MFRILCYKGRNVWSNNNSEINQGFLQYDYSQEIPKDRFPKCNCILCASPVCKYVNLVRYFCQQLVNSSCLLKIIRKRKMQDLIFYMWYNVVLHAKDNPHFDQLRKLGGFLSVEIFFDSSGANRNINDSESWVIEQSSYPFLDYAKYRFKNDRYNKKTTCLILKLNKQVRSEYI